MCAVARATVGLPYYPARMSRETGPREALRSYALHRAGSSALLRAGWRWGLERPPHAVGTLEHFLIERYSLFSRAHGGALLRVDVRHPKWALVNAEVDRFEETLFAAAVPSPSGPPLAQASAGVDVEFIRWAVVEPEVRWLRALRPRRAPGRSAAHSR
ncbi:MAG: DUF2071 domain-containing protein [Myxococcaceae bacterium]|nr:DUF2071 domain-containing protein [Myxococcaceae bacterium]